MRSRFIVERITEYPSLERKSPDGVRRMRFTVSASSPSRLTLSSLAPPSDRGTFLARSTSVLTSSYNESHTLRCFVLSTRRRYSLITSNGDWTIRSTSSGITHQEQCGKHARDQTGFRLGRRHCSTHHVLLQNQPIQHLDQSWDIRRPCFQDRLPHLLG
ncbi:hypothetical protein BDZ89DRAFT_766023 [Hymenopellis radicata]|nr:hypothetical protein BDZ89DRAFT_766023 [Hymenopellis radicata]